MMSVFARPSELGMESILKGREMLKEMAHLRMGEEGGTKVEGLEYKEVP